jgi:hypothetical protein
MRPEDWHSDMYFAAGDGEPCKGKSVLEKYKARMEDVERRLDMTAVKISELEEVTYLSFLRGWQHYYPIKPWSRGKERVLNFFPRY